MLSTGSGHAIMSHNIIAAMLVAASLATAIAAGRHVMAKPQTGMDEYSTPVFWRTRT
jgi:hypothetical protein